MNTRSEDRPETRAEAMKALRIRVLGEFANLGIDWRHVDEYHRIYDPLEIRTILHWARFRKWRQRISGPPKVTGSYGEFLDHFVFAS